MNLMRTLYLVFSHHHQEQLLRLVTTIRQLSPNGIIVIHHDPSGERLNTLPYADKENIHIIPHPVCGQWGDFSLVEQYLHSFRWCLENLDFDWLVTITGLSYPIMQLQKFESYLEHSENDAYAYHFNAFDPNHWPEGTGKKRYLFAYFKLPKNPYYYKLPSNIKAALGSYRIRFNQIQPFFRIISMPRGGATRLGVRRWRLPFNKRFTIYGGRQMININRKALDEIFSFLNENKKYISYSKRTLIPDESFFLNILCNSPNLNVCNDILRHIKWPDNINHASSVDVILSDEVEKAIQSGNPFALKFDVKIDPKSLDIVDKFLGI